MEANPDQLKYMTDLPSKIIHLDDVMDEGKQNANNNVGSILLDREERELVKQGENITKEDMWKLLETKRFDKLKSSAINLQGDLIYN